MRNKSKKIIIVILIALVCLGAIFICYNFVGTSNKYIGQWHDEENEISIDIYSEENTYYITVTGKCDDDSIYLWEMEAKKSGNKLAYKDATKYLVTYDSFGDTVEEEVYTDGKGIFYIKGLHLYWEDDSEQFGEGVSFLQ